MKTKIHRVSTLNKTWIFDLDGTIVRHNGYKTPEGEQLLPGALNFFRKLPPGDKVIILTSRSSKYKLQTENFLTKNKIPFDYILYDMPYGERIIINDKKPSGLSTALAINTERDTFMAERFQIDETV